MDLSEAALADTRAVVALGARHVGKSTPLQQDALAEGAYREVLALDNQAVRTAAAADPAPRTARRPTSSQASFI